MSDEQEFGFKGTINGKEISVTLKAGDIMKILERNLKMDELKQAKVKMKKVEYLLGGEV